MLTLCRHSVHVSALTVTSLADVTSCRLLVFQGVSVSVSVLTLTSISVERWYAICRPLAFKATPTRAKHIISLTWLVSMLIIIPELIVLDTHHQLPPELTIFLTSCQPSWSHHYQAAYQFFLTVAMYLLPFMLMFGAYIQIARCLWRTSIPSESSKRSPRSVGFYWLPYPT